MSCFLVYDEANGGTVNVVYSKVEAVENAMAVFKASSEKRLPEFRFIKDGGVAELAQNIDSDAMQLSQAWCDYIVTARKYFGDLTLLDDPKMTLLFFNTSFRAEDHLPQGFGRLVKIQIGETVPAHEFGESFAACSGPDLEELFKNPKMPLSEFLSNARSCGTTTSFAGKAPPKKASEAKPKSESRDPNESELQRAMRLKRLNHSGSMSRRRSSAWDEAKDRDRDPEKRESKSGVRRSSLSMMHAAMQLRKKEQDILKKSAQHERNKYAKKWYPDGTSTEGLSEFNVIQGRMAHGGRERSLAQICYKAAEIANMAVAAAFEAESEAQNTSLGMHILRDTGTTKLKASDLHSGRLDLHRGDDEDDEDDITHTMIKDVSIKNMAVGFQKTGAGKNFVRKVTDEAHTEAKRKNWKMRDKKTARRFSWEADEEEDEDEDLGFDPTTITCFYKYEELQPPFDKLGHEVNHHHLEMYLSNAEFKEIFSTTKKQFALLPKWKQATLKFDHKMHYQG